MSSYSDVDPVITKWVEATGSTLFTVWADARARFFYIPGDPPFECFQISVELPQEGQIAVHASAVDTNDDTEGDLEAFWEGQVAELDGLLARAIATADTWKGRTRKRPDPASPW